MKSLLIPFILYSSIMVAQPQSVLYYENFDNPGTIKVSNGFTTSSGSNPAVALWKDTIDIFTSSPHSYYVNSNQRGNTIWFETDSFNTIGMPYPSFSFNHICKSASYDTCFVEFSLDSGKTWTPLPGSGYHGTNINRSSYFVNDYFNGYSHPIYRGGTWSLGEHVDNSHWVKEYFDLRGVAYDTATNSGYNDVRLRFRAQMNTIPLNLAQGSFEGWFVDDLEVVGDTCPTLPAFISFNVPQFGCDYSNRPTGLVVNDSINGHRIVLEAWDYLYGVDSVELFWKNGGVWDTIPMNLMFFDIYEATINNVRPNDTVQWFIQAYNGACNPTRAPISGDFEFYTNSGYSTKCGSPQCDKYPIVNGLPWEEGFEGNEWMVGDNGEDFENGIFYTNNHRGTFSDTPQLWKVAPSEDLSNQNKYAWCVGDSSTFTYGTGPVSSYAQNSTKFLYAESSVLNGTNTALITPCLDLTNQPNCLALEFYYHMFGEDIEGLTIDIDTGGVQAQWYNSYLYLDGEQQQSSSDSWKKALVSLSEFAGKVIRIRFIAIRSSTEPKADIALDNIRLFEADYMDLGVVASQSPLPFSCNFSSLSDVSITIQNTACVSPPLIPLAYQLNGGAVVRDTLFTIPSNFELGDSITFTFSSKVDLTQKGSYDLRVWLDVLGDTISGNDTLTFNSILHSNLLSTFPFTNGFESAQPAQSLRQKGVLASPYFSFSEPLDSNKARWVVFDHPIRSLQSGPLEAANGDNFLVFVDPNGDLISDEATLEIGCLSFPSWNYLVMTLKSHNMGGINAHIEVQEEGQADWNWVGIIDRWNSMQKDEPYALNRFDMSSYSGKTVRLRIVATGDKDKDLSYLAIDDISFSRENSDIALNSVSTPSNNIEIDLLNSNLMSQFEICRLGSWFPSPNLVNFKVELTEACNSLNPSVYQGQAALSNPTFSSSPIFPMSCITANENLNFPVNVKQGSYKLKAWIEVSGDINPINDTIYGRLNVLTSKNVPYFNDFDSCDYDFVVDGEVLDWQRTDMEKGIGWDTAYSGQNCWITHPSENTLMNTTEMLYAPLFVGMDTIYRAELRFRHQYNFDITSHGIVQYSANGQNWSTLNLPGNQGNNWMSPYPYSQYASSAFQGVSNGWVQSSYPLDFLTGYQDTIYLRFLSVTNSMPSIGWAIDDFEISVPYQNATSPLNIKFSNQLPKDGNNAASVEIVNSGQAPLREFGLTIFKNGGIVYQNTEVLSSPLVPGKTRSINLSSFLALNIGINELEIITSLPNDRTDAYVFDDTLQTSIYIPDVVNAFPYCADFETEKEFLNFNVVSSTIDTNWLYGNPNKALLSGVYSGSYSWFTSSGEYGPLQNQYLYTPKFTVEAGQCYDLSFFHRYETEFNFDGCMLQYSLDGDSTWETLGSYLDSMWYNTPHIHALDAIHPGWSGSSNGWQKAKKIIQFAKLGRVRFRFRFASNATVVNEGWLIDNFCFEKANGICDYIGTKNSQLHDNSFFIFPNPVVDYVDFEYNGPNHGEAIIYMQNSVGSIVKKEKKFLVPGDSFRYDVSELSKGIYLFRIEFSNTQILSEKFEKL